MRTVTQAVLTDNQSARLDRILAATEQLLRERGAEGMTMRDVAAASQVAEGTLYNRFGGKDGLITIAALDYFDRRVQSLLKRHPTKSPVQKIEYTVKAGTNAILEAPPLARALMQAYYRVDDKPHIRGHLTQTVYNTVLPITQEMQTLRYLRSWAPASLLCSELCERIFGVTLRWAQGQVPDKSLHDHMVTSMLIVVAGASRRVQMKEVERIIERVSFPHLYCAGT